MKKRKLHELLAIEQSHRQQADACAADLKNTFEKKTNHFTERIVTVKSVTEGEPDKQETQLSLQTSVDAELRWIGEKLVKAIDVSAQVDLANTQAKADVVLSDGTLLLKSIPATTLLQLEKRLAAFMAFIKAIPTLDPSKGFTADPTRGAGIFMARPEVRPKTEKKFEFVVMVPSTDKHPAQVKELTVDRVVAHTTTQEWSSLITVSAKGEMLDRLEDLTRSVKAARARANEQEIDGEQKFGAALVEYVFGLSLVK